MDDGGPSAAFAAGLVGTLMLFQCAVRVWGVVKASLKLLRALRSFALKLLCEKTAETQYEFEKQKTQSVLPVSAGTAQRLLRPMLSASFANGRARQELNAPEEKQKRYEHEPH